MTTDPKIMIACGVLLLALTGAVFLGRATVDPCVCPDPVIDSGRDSTQQAIGIAIGEARAKRALADSIAARRERDERKERPIDPHARDATRALHSAGLDSIRAACFLPVD